MLGNMGRSSIGNVCVEDCPCAEVGRPRLPVLCVHRHPLGPDGMTDMAGSTWPCRVGKMIVASAVGQRTRRGGALGFAWVNIRSSIRSQDPLGRRGRSRMAHGSLGSRRSFGFQRKESARHVMSDPSIPGPTIDPTTDPTTDGDRRRTHLVDSFGPVCQVYGEDPLTSNDYRDVTCGHCRGTASFISALPDHLKPRSARRRSWRRSMQE